MRYPASETAEKHQKILHEAACMFRGNGFAGVSIGEIMKAADLTHGSFYNHFGSKEVLMGDCVTHLQDRSLAFMDSFEPSAAGRKSFVTGYLSTATRDAPETACLIASLGADIARQPSVKPAMTGYVQGFIGKLMSHFPSGRKDTARRNAIRAIASMVGAMVLARAVDDKALSDEILREVLAQLTEKPASK